MVLHNSSHQLNKPGVNAFQLSFEYGIKSWINPWSSANGFWRKATQRAWIQARIKTGNGYLSLNFSLKINMYVYMYTFNDSVICCHIYHVVVFDYYTTSAPFKRCYRFLHASSCSYDIHFCFCFSFRLAGFI